MTKISNPYPIFLDSRGALVDGGYVYIGEPNEDPETSPIQAYWDADFTIPAVQPIRTLGGYLVNETVPGFLFIDGDDYSMRVRDANMVQVTYTVSSTDIDPLDFQPASAQLDTFSTIPTTSFGLSLLSLANSAALKTATGIPDCLPRAGGQMTGNITRSGGGTHLYHADSAFGSGRVFITAAAASDPTSAAGDIWIRLDV